MGEAKRRANVAAREAVEALSVDTVGGRAQVPGADAPVQLRRLDCTAASLLRVLFVNAVV